MKRKMVLAGLASMAMATAVNAATLTVTAQVTHAYSDANATTEILPTPSPSSGVAALYQVDYSVQVSGLVAPETGFGNLAANFAIPGLSQQFGWIATTETYDPPGPAGPVAVFPTNADSGASTTDLQNIVVSIAAGFTSADPRGVVGVAAPKYIGSLYVQYNGVGTGTLDGTVTGWSTNNNGVLTTQQGPSSIGDVVFTPEPASLSLLALGGLMLRRRR